MFIRECLIRDNEGGEAGYGPIDEGICSGGGIYCSSAMIQDCNFVGNRTGTWRTDYAYGGGIFIDGGDTTVRNCTFNGNFAAFTGGAVYLCEGAVFISHCIFSQNVASSWYYGGDAMCNEKGELSVVNSTFTNNGDEKNSFAVVFSHAGNLILNHCTISENSSTGIRFSEGNGTMSHCLVKRNSLGVSVYFGNFMITHCTVEENGSQTGGGALNCYTDDRFTMNHCIIRNNTGRHSAAGLVLSGHDGEFIMHNCFIAGNRAYGSGFGGGGICCHHNASPVISNCTITGNWSNYKGGGICSVRDVPSGEGPTIINSIIRGNMAPFGRQIAVTTYSDPYAGAYFPSSITVAHSLVEGGPEDVYVEPDSTLNWGAGNMSVDPLFVRLGYWADVNDPNIVVEPNDLNAILVMGDYHLSQVAAGQALDSPCVDSGSDLAGMVGMDKFTTRTDKVADTGIVDMGYHYIEHIADLNNDAVIDGKDISILAYQWRQQPAEPSADIAPVHGDGFVDLRDLALLAENWLWPGG